MTIELQLILLALMLVLSAFFAMAETALISLSKYKVRHWVEKKRFGSIYVQKLKGNPEALLSTILIGNNLANTAAAALTTSIAIQYFKDNAVGIAIGIATLLILMIGDIVPKSIGGSNNEAIAPLVAPIIWNLNIAMYPVVFVLDNFLKGINKLIGSKKMSLVTKEEMRAILRVSGEEGSLKEIEKNMVERIFDFENITVGDVMTRKKFMVTVGSDMPIKEVLQLPTAKMYSRFPVYEKSKDNIVGIVYLKDMLRHIKEGNFEIPVKQIMRKPFFVFANKKMDTMLKLFQGRKQHMAIVIDQKANVLGIVTIENILEEIVGEIIDESDRINPSLAQIEKNEWIAKGSIEIDELDSKTGLSIKKSDYIDLDHFILSELGRPAKIGEEINYQNFKLIMEDVQGKKVLRVRIFRVLR